MNKILLVAKREFVTTVANRGFLIGLFVMPALIALFIFVGSRLMTARSPQVTGQVAVMDATGRVVPLLRETLAPSAIEARRAAEARRALAGVPGADRAGAPMQRAFGTVPHLTVVERPPDADLAREKAWLSNPNPTARPLALVVVRADAVERAPGKEEFGTFDIYASPNLDDGTESALFDSLREALVNARLASARIDKQQIDAMTRVSRPTSVIVTAAGERRAQRQFMRLLPFLVGVFIFVGVVMGGQSLMTSTVEEKSSRVVEVLLAAVSPFQLMAGKLIGQLGVGLLAIGIYLGLGLLALYSFAIYGVINPMLIVYFVVFFLITYVVFGALMMSIGAAVNQIQEAQSLMGPVMLLLVLPYMLSPMVGRAPNSPFSVALSFIPPVNSFAMMTRMASDAPPPAWQVWLTILVGLGAACIAIWFAGKIFKIGLLMHGRPPSFATLIRWARAA